MQLSLLSFLPYRPFCLYQSSPRSHLCLSTRLYGYLGYLPFRSQEAEAERDAATLLIRSRAENEARVLKTQADNAIKIKTAEVGERCCKSEK